MLSESFEAVGTNEVPDDPVDVCSSPGRPPPLLATLFSWAPIGAAVVLPRGAVKPFCFMTGSSFMLSRYKRGIGMGWDRIY